MLYLILLLMNLTAHSPHNPDAPLLEGHKIFQIYEHGAATYVKMASFTLHYAGQDTFLFTPQKLFLQQDQEVQEIRGWRVYAYGTAEELATPIRVSPGDSVDFEISFPGIAVSGYHLHPKQVILEGTGHGTLRAPLYTLRGVSPQSIMIEAPYPHNE